MSHFSNNSSNNKDYVTVVTVDNNCLNNLPSVIDKASPFVTVLSINSDAPRCMNVTGTECVSVHRLAGDRLGFGLKFQGGTKSNEKIQRLYIQSCAPESPASRVKASWGVLKEGDEILEINGVDVRQLSRIECVQNLKESSEHIRLLVRNGHGHLSTFKKNNKENKVEKRIAPPPPPPVPPRKLHRKKSDQNLNTIILSNTRPQSCEDMHPPTDAEFYMNIFTDENERASLKGSESDADTASTISTVIDKYSDKQSLCSSLSLDSDFGINRSTSMESLAKVLKPFQLLEKEFQLDPKHKMEIRQTNSKSEYVPMHGVTYEVMELKPRPTTKPPVKPPRQDYENVNMKSVSNQKKMVYENIEVKTPPTPLPRQQPPSPKLSPQSKQKEILVEPKKRTLIANIVPTPRVTTNNVNNNNNNKKPNSSNSKNVTNSSKPQIKYGNTSVTEFNTIQTWLQDASEVVHECPVSERLSLQVNIEGNSRPPFPSMIEPMLRTEEDLPEVVNVVHKKPMPRREGSSLIVDYSKLENEVFAMMKPRLQEEEQRNEVVEKEANNPTNNSIDEITETLFDSLECEEDENMGPPELFSETGPSEAYFNCFWSLPPLPTIGEADEDMSSLEYQQNK